MKRLPTILFFLSIIFISRAQDYAWTRGFGGKESDSGIGIAVDAQGNSYVTGFFSDTVDVDPGPAVVNLISQGDRDVFVMKLSPTGNVIWAKAIGGSLSIWAMPGDDGFSIGIDNSGSVYVTGAYAGTVDFDPGAGTFSMTANGQLQIDFFVLKLNNSGNFVWAKSIGGSGVDVAYGIAVNASGDSYITGAFQDVVDFDPGPQTYSLGSYAWDKPFVLKLDASGNFVWAKVFQSPNTPNYQGQGRAITLDASGAVAVTGYYLGSLDFDPGPLSYTLTSVSYTTSFSSIPTHDLFVAKLDAAGNFVWAKSVGSAAQVQDYGKAICVDNASNIYLTGFIQNEADYDPGVGTYTMSAPGGFILKLDASGNFIWARPIGIYGLGTTTGCGLVADSYNNIHCLGYFQGTVDFDPSPATYSMNAGSFSSIFLLRLNAIGNFDWVKNVGASGSSTNDEIGGVTMSSAGALYLTTHFSGVCDFDPGPSSYTLLANNYDMFVTKFEPEPVGFAELRHIEQQLLVFPNPSSGCVFIQSEINTDGQNYSLYDQTGRELISGTLIGTNTQIDVSLLAPGIYFLGMDGGKPVKLVKE